MPKVHFYLRESHAYSAASGLSHATQEGICQDYYRLRLAHLPDLELGETVYDAATSARSVPFLERPGGKRLDEIAQRGDHVVFAYHDRGYRTIRDYANLFHAWNARGIIMHFANLCADLSTAEGRFIASNLVVVAELQSDMISKRNKDVARCLKAKNRPRNQKVPFGFRAYLAGSGTDWQLVPYVNERKLMKMATWLKDRGHTWAWIANSLDELTKELRQQHPHERCYRIRSWTEQQVRRAVRAWRAICEREGGEEAAISLPVTHRAGSPGTEDPTHTDATRATRWH